MTPFHVEACLSRPTHPPGIPLEGVGGGRGGGGLGRGRPPWGPMFLEDKIIWGGGNVAATPLGTQPLAKARTGPGRSLTGKRKLFRNMVVSKTTACSPYVQPSLVAIGGWRLVEIAGWRLAVGGWRRLAAVGGGWQLVMGGWWQLAAVDSWRLAVGGWWQ